MNSLSLVFAALILAYSLTSAQDPCIDAIKKCKKTTTTGESLESNCSKLRSALDCVKNVASSSVPCTSEQLSYIQSDIDLAYKESKRIGCSGAGTLMTSILLCLGLSGVAYFLTAPK